MSNCHGDMALDTLESRSVLNNDAIGCPVGPILDGLSESLTDCYSCTFTLGRILANSVIRATSQGEYSVAMRYRADLSTLRSSKSQ